VFLLILGSLTNVANRACEEESEAPCTLANCDALDLFPSGQKKFLNVQTALYCEAESFQQTFFQRGLEYISFVSVLLDGHHHPHKEGC
jgi:hypothetical protein